MKYFIDFEATQFSNEIIEIGCIREDGAKFKSYVNAENKLTKFIINLTGITQEVIDNAPSSDTVFSFFYRWLQEDNSNIEFYCYGNSDIDFVKKNLQKTKNFEAQAALSMIGMSLNDYSQFVKKHFGLIKPIGLVKVLAYYRGVESIEQTHDALDDAIFLKELFDFIEAEEECSEDEGEKEEEKPEEEEKSEEKEECSDEEKMADKDAKISELENIIMEKDAEIAELKKYKEDKECAERDFAVQQTLEELRECVDEETLESLKVEGLACKLSDIDGWKNKAKALAFDRGSKKEMSTSIWSMAIPKPIAKESTSKWDSI